MRRIDVDEVASDRAELPALLHGYPPRVLLSWAKERILCPNAEIREALRSPRVLEVLRQLAACPDNVRRLEGRVIA